MMIVLVGATGVLVAAIAALALQSWWVLIALLLLHAVVTTSRYEWMFWDAALRMESWPI